MQTAMTATNSPVDLKVKIEKEAVLQWLRRSRTEVLKEGSLASMPILALDLPGFMGLGGANPELAAFNGPRKLFGTVKSIYVHGSLEREVGYDICRLASGFFQDKMLQPAGLVDEKGDLHFCVIVMITSDAGNKYAFVVHPDDDEITRAARSLYNGEWLRDGKERW